MEDSKILDLYWKRDEEAIVQTELTYGQKLHGLSYRILANHEDAQECVSDTYLKAWQTIPPQRPTYFFAYLAKICRFLCFGRLDRMHAAKRRAELVQLTSEMEMCIPDHRQDMDLSEEALGELINQFLEGLNRESRVIFLRRYWYADSVKDIATACGISESKVKTQLHRTRLKLRTYLQKEGITV